MSLPNSSVFNAILDVYLSIRTNDKKLQTGKKDICLKYSTRAHEAKSIEDWSSIAKELLQEIKEEYIRESGSFINWLILNKIFYNQKFFLMKTLTAALTYALSQDEKLLVIIKDEKDIQADYYKKFFDEIIKVDDPKAKELNEQNFEDFLANVINKKRTIIDENTKAQVTDNSLQNGGQPAAPINVTPIAKPEITEAKAGADKSCQTSAIEIEAAAKPVEPELKPSPAMKPEEKALTHNELLQKRQQERDRQREIERNFERRFLSFLDAPAHNCNTSEKAYFNGNNWQPQLTSINENATLNSTNKQHSAVTECKASASDVIYDKNYPPLSPNPHTTEKKPVQNSRKTFVQIVKKDITFYKPKLQVKTRSQTKKEEEQQAKVEEQPIRPAKKRKWN